MNILSIDTATTPHSVSLRTKDEVVSLISLNASTQSEDMFLEINALLQKAQLDYKNLDAILCTIGPGSFTGIRIGIAAIRGIKKILPHIKIHGFTTLELIAYSRNKNINNTDTNHSFNVITNAFGNEIYLQKFDTKNNQLSDIEVVHKDKLFKRKSKRIFVSNDRSIIEKNDIPIELVEYDATTLIKYYLHYPDKVQAVKPLYIKKPNIHHGTFRKDSR